MKYFKLDEPQVRALINYLSHEYISYEGDGSTVHKILDDANNWLVKLIKANKSKEDGSIKQ